MNMLENIAKQMGFKRLAPASYRDQVNHHFAGAAKGYDLEAVIQKKIAKHLADHLPHMECQMMSSEKRHRILEIGCGTGLFTRHLLEKYPASELVVTDIVSEMLDQTASNLNPKIKQGGHNVAYLQLDGEHSFNLGQFDLVTCSMVLQWFKEPQQALKYWWSQLNKNGALVYASLAPGCFPEWRTALQDLNLETGLLAPKPLPGTFLEEDVVVNYENGLAFLRSLKTTGTNTPRPGYHHLPGSDLRRALAIYDARYKGQITWRIAFGLITQPNQFEDCCSKADASPQSHL